MSTSHPPFTSTTRKGKIIYHPHNGVIGSRGLFSTVNYRICKQIRMRSRANKELTECSDTNPKSRFLVEVQYRLQVIRILLSVCPYYGSSFPRL